MKAFRVSVVAPAHPQIDIEAQSVCVPAQTGALGVRYGHLPLLTILKIGLVHIRDVAGHDRWFGVTGGFFEMMGDHAVVLADDLISENEAFEPNEAYDRRPTLLFPAEFASPLARYDFARSLLRRRLEKAGRRPSSSS